MNSIKYNQTEKSICLVIPSLRHGGAERVISILSNEWCKLPNVKIFLLLLTKQKKYYFIDDRVEIIEPNWKYLKNPLGKLFYTVWIMFFIRNNINRISPSAILSFCERYNNIVILALKSFRTPLFVSDRNNPENNIGIIHEFLRKNLYTSVSGIIAQTVRGKKILYKKTKNSNILNIPNPLRIIDLKGLKKEKIILNVGRNVKQKNQLELLEIFSKLKNAEDWNLLIIGEGPLRETLILKSLELGIENRTKFLEFQSDIDSYYEKSSIFAFTSIYEGFPNALVEAMAHGIPCIAYDCPTGPSELINHGESGYLVRLYDQLEYIEKLQQLIDNIELRNNLGAVGRNISSQFSVEQVSNRYLNFILNQNETYY